MKRTNRLLGILLTLVMLLSLLPAPAQAIGKDPIIEVPTTLTFTTEPQSGTGLKTEGYYTVTWATNKTPSFLLLQIMVTNRLDGEITWANVGPAVEPTGSSGTITVQYPSLETQRPNEQSTYCLNVAYQGTEVETATYTFTVTWTDKTYAVTVNGGTGTGEYVEGEPVTITADEPASGKEFKEWDGADGLTFTDGSAATAAAIFTMPAEAVELTATYRWQKPDTTPVRPEGDGTSGNPFQIGTVGELYWFAGFVNGTIEKPADITVSIDEACAKVMNDITVNPDLLTADYALNEEDTAQLAAWEPIALANGYKGTFDGQDYTISGLYYDPQTTQADIEYGGLFGQLAAGGCICNLTLEDSYFCAPTEKASAYTGGIVGEIGTDASVENCHFDGTVTTPNKGNIDYLLGGIAGICAATIRDCTSMGLITGYFTYGGGIVGQLVSDTTGSGQIIGCRNEADVLGLRLYEDTVADAAGGIAGRLNDGIIRDCSNEGCIDAGDYQGGIAGYADGTNNASATISRCWNEGETIAGIVQAIYRNVHVKNCYNVGTVSYGIVGDYLGSTNSLSYCHNAGTASEKPILGPSSSGAGIMEVANCYYMADSETDDDGIDGTTPKLPERFSNQTIQMVTKLLNSGNNGNWKQGGGYPVLNTVYTLTVKGGTGSGTYGVGVEVTVTATVPEGMVFAGWEGLDGLIIEAGQPAEDSVSTTFLMPKRDVELTAKFVSLTPVRPEGRGSVLQPFEISTVGELYWFAGFVNGTITAADISISKNEVHAKLMNDITVNPGLLADDYTLNVGEENTDLLAAWEPIDPESLYMGTFDGQGYAISGIYCSPQPDGQYYGFFGRLGENFHTSGCIRDLTLKDSYFCAPARNNAYTGAFAGRLASGCTVENCHFDGTVTTAITADSADKENYGYIRIAGIAGDVDGEIRDCTARGLISGYGEQMGGIATYVGLGEVSGCVNEATVENTRSDTGYLTGGIAGRLQSGTIRDCCNKGDVIGRSSGGIVCRVESKDGEVIRCWNEGDIQGNYSAGIASLLSGTILNCYNAGSVTSAGIVELPYTGSSVTYCHNFGTVTDGNDKAIVSDDSFSITLANCYYQADSECDALNGTTYKTAAEFKDGTVLTLLNGGDNAGSWTQGTDYPVLNTLYTLTVNGGTGGGEYAAGAEVTITATVPDGKVFASWSGTEGLTFTGDTDKFSATATFTMPAESLTVEAVCNTLITKANAYVTVPLVGAYPDVTPESGDPDKYTVEFESWRLVTASSGELSGVDLTESDSFEKLGTGQSYQLDVLFVPKEGYQFASNATYTLNDDLTTVPFSTNYRYRRYSFKDIDELVTSINLKGIIAPAAGKNPNTNTITTDTAGISLSAMQWKKPGGAAMASTDKFTAGDTYTLHIEYTVKSGYVVSDGVTVSSNLADSTYTANTTADPKYVDIQYTVPVAATYPVTIIGGKFNVPGGTDSGEFAPDSTLAIIATPPEGKRFVKWTSEDVSFSNEYASATSFRMPACPVAITAVYEDSHYSCTIEGGTFADGSTSSKFEVYEKVVIIPNDPPAGKMFSHWEATPAAGIRESSDGTYYFSMPNWAVQIQAVYVDVELCMDAWRDSTEVSGGYSEVVSVKVEHLNTVEGLDPTSGAVLVVARYSCNDDDYGKMTDVYLCSVKEDGTYVTPAYVCGEEEWFEYQVSLVNGKTWEPLYDTYWVSGD